MTTVELHWYSSTPNGSTPADTLDLFGGASGIVAAYNGLLRTAGDREAATIKETFTMRADGADFDELAAVLQTLDLWQKRVAWSLSDVDLHEVWLLMQLGDETNALEAQVLDLQYNVADDILNYSEPHVNQLTLVITRTPWEEAKDTAIPTLSYSSVSALGGVVGANEAGYLSIVSDLPARVPELEISSGSATLTEIWLAFQSDRLRNPSAFVPVWPLSSAQAKMMSADTQSESDTGAYNGTRLTCDFATEEDALTRVTLLMSDIGSSADFLAQTGHFELLLRACVSDANTEVHLRMGYGWREISPNIDSTIWRDLFPLTATSYTLFDLQSIAIPPARLLTDCSNFKIAIEASRVSGSGSLYLDCLGLLPIDEGMIHLLVPALLTTQRENIVKVFVSPGGQCQGYIMQDDKPSGQIVADSESWNLPTNGSAPNLIGFAQRSTGSGLSDSMDVTLQYCRRFRLMRGAI